MNKYFTFTEDDVEKSGMDYVVTNLDPKILEIVDTEVCVFKSELICSMSGCGSPIEQRLALSLHEVNNSLYIVGRAAKLELDVIGIETHVEVIVEHKRYKVDFLIPVACNNGQPSRCFVIECDGHDFHEKTKEQVCKDKERERNIVKSGKTVIRFSGSEIYNNAYKCAREVFDIIFSHFESR